jgi:predicted ATPase
LAKVLISYRRSDSAGIVGRIYDRLVARYGADGVFLDVDNIPFGVDFREHVRERLAGADVVLAIVGSYWLGASNGHVRIHDDDDPVRMEIEAVLAAGTPLCPVLIDGARMPSERELPPTLSRFAYVNAAPLDAGRDFEHDVSRLIASLDALLGAKAPPPPVPADAREAPSSNLPRQLTSFVGRERELAMVAAELAVHRLVTLTGFGGVGKTRLAFESGWRLIGDFADGVHVVELAPVADPELVASRIAAAVGAPAQAGQLTGDLWIDAVREKRMLVILDNCEHLLDAVASTTIRLLERCVSVRVLATSREPLRVPGERVIQIAPLALPAYDESDAVDETIRTAPAVALFLERVYDTAPELALSTAERHTWVSIRNVCTHLDGIPLALELAAARVASLGLPALERGLHDRFRLLSRGSRTSLPRQQTLQATLDWSYGALSGQEQDVFKRLGVFAGGFTAEAAGNVVRGEIVDEDEVVYILGSLVDKSLVVIDAGGRYGLLETTRAYALQQIGAGADAHATFLRHAEYYHSLSLRVRAAFGTRPFAEWTAEYRLELDNFRAAMVWAIDERNNVLLGAEILCNLTRLLEWLLLHAEVLRWCERALAAFDGTARPLLEADIQLTATRQRHAVGAFHAAIASAERAAALYRTCAATLPLAYALTLLSKGISSYPERREEADRTLDEALAIYAEADARDAADDRPGEPQMVRFTMASLAGAFKAFTIDPAEAERRRAYLLESLERFRTLIPGHWIIGILLAFLSEVALEAEQYESALAWASESVEEYHRPGSSFGYIFALNACATAQLAMERRDKAHDAARELLGFSRRIGSAPGFAMALLLLATIEADGGNAILAAGLLGAWESSAGKLDCPVATATFLLARLRPALSQSLDRTTLIRAVADGARWSVDEAMNIATTSTEQR